MFTPDGTRLYAFRNMVSFFTDNPKASYRRRVDALSNGNPSKKSLTNFAVFFTNFSFLNNLMNQKREFDDFINELVRNPVENRLRNLSNLKDDNKNKDIYDSSKFTGANRYMVSFEEMDIANEKLKEFISILDKHSRGSEINNDDFSSTAVSTHAFHGFLNGIIFYRNVFYTKKINEILQSAISMKSEKIKNLEQNFAGEKEKKEILECDDLIYNLLKEQKILKEKFDIQRESLLNFYNEDCRDMDFKRCSLYTFSKCLTNFYTNWNREDISLDNIIHEADEITNLLFSDKYAVEKNKKPKNKIQKRVFFEAFNVSMTLDYLYITKKLKSTGFYDLWEEKKNIICDKKIDWFVNPDKDFFEDLLNIIGFKGVGGLGKNVDFQNIISEFAAVNKNEKYYFSSVRNNKTISMISLIKNSIFSLPEENQFLLFNNFLLKEEGFKSDYYDYSKEVAASVDSNKDVIKKVTNLIFSKHDDTKYQLNFLSYCVLMCFFEKYTLNKERMLKDDVFKNKMNGLLLGFVSSNRGILEFISLFNQYFLKEKTNQVDCREFLLKGFSSFINEVQGNPEIIDLLVLTFKKELDKNSHLLVKYSEGYDLNLSRKMTRFFQGIYLLAHPNPKMLDLRDGLKTKDYIEKVNKNLNDIKILEKDANKLNNLFDSKRIKGLLNFVYNFCYTKPIEMVLEKMEIVSSLNNKEEDKDKKEFTSEINSEKNINSKNKFRF